MGALTTHVDLLTRKSTKIEREMSLLPSFEQAEISTKTRETMLTVSASAKFYDLFRLLGSFSQELKSRRQDRESRQSVSAGLALVNKEFSLSYIVNRPYLWQSEIRHGVSASIAVNI
jgi:hypothetical protein